MALRAHAASRARYGPGQARIPCKLGLPGAIAQMGERLLCKQEVTGSIPVGSTRRLACKWPVFRFLRSGTRSDRAQFSAIFAASAQ